jgi:hypothetical protein
MMCHLTFGAALLSLGCSVNSEEVVHPSLPDSSHSDSAPGVVEASLDVAVEAAESAGANDDAASDSVTGPAPEGGPAGADVMSPPADTGHSVLERNKHPSRDGNFLEPLFTKAKAATLIVDTGFHATFGGAMWASPLYMEHGPNGAGAFFAATTNNTVFALEEATGAVVWTTNIGPPATRPVVGCGDIHPIGILGTPIIDDKTRTLYVAGNMGPGATTGFEVHALSVDDGKERAGWPVGLKGLVAGGLAFDAGSQNQRGALSLVNGILYVPFGGHNGDCGPYHGWVVAIDTANPTKVSGWATADAGGAIWAAGGMVSDGDGVIAVTGNSNAGQAQHQDGEEVVRVTGMGVVNRNDANIFYPSRWRNLDVADDDFGASGPILVQVPGTPSMVYVVATTKDGHVYFLDSKNLGGMDGQAAEHVVAGVSHSVRTGHTSHATTLGIHVALTVDDHAVCPGGAAGPVLMSILVPPGAAMKPETSWCTPIVGFIGTGGTHRTTAPITTTTDGRNDAIVWVVSGTTLLGVDGDTGKVIYTGGTCDNVRQWTSPIAVKGRIIAGGDGHLCAWKLP